MNLKFPVIILTFALAGCIEDPSNFSFPIDAGDPTANNANNTNNPPNNKNNANNPPNNENNPNNTNNPNNIIDLGKIDMSVADMSSDMMVVEDMAPDLIEDLGTNDLGTDARVDMADIDMCMVTEGGEEICDGVDNDCDGMIDNANAFPCPLQKGVCAGSMTTECPMDLTVEPLSCDGDEYGADYEEIETMCGDMLDNDCDGLPDCADPDCDGKPCAAERVCSNNACLN